MIELLFRLIVKNREITICYKKVQYFKILKLLNKKHWRKTNNTVILHRNILTY